MKHLQAYEAYRVDESYEDVGIEYTKSKQKVWNYTNYDDEIIIGDYTYLRFKTEDDWHLWGRVLVFDNADGTEVANSSYGKEFADSQLKCTIDVRPDKRRLGIGSNMYKWIEELVGEPIYPDTPHSAKAQLFWANPKRPFGIATYESFKQPVEYATVSRQEWQEDANNPYDQWERSMLDDYAEKLMSMCDRVLNRKEYLSLEEREDYITYYDALQKYSKLHLPASERMRVKSVYLMIMAG